MSEDQIQAGGIELELSNTKKNLMEALNQNADLQKQVEERGRQIKAVGEALGLIGITVNHTNEDNKRTDWTIVDSVSRCVEEKDQRIKELEAEVAETKEALKGMVQLWDDNNPDDKCSCMGSSPDCKYPPPCELCVARHALSTPTGTKLLSKIEAGEKMNLALQLVKDQILGGDLDVADYVRVGINSALSAYRATCEGGVKC